jgi:C1A family cysteine protease
MKIIQRLSSLSLFALVLSLAACGGGSSSDSGNNSITSVGNSSSSVSSPSETLFVRDNAWSGARPTDAVTVTPEEFRQSIASGEAVVISANRGAAQRAARAQQMSTDLAYLKALPTPSPAIQALLADAAADPTAVGDVSMNTTADIGHPVALLGLEIRLREAVQNQELSKSSANALLIYTQTYAVLSDAVKAQVPTPDSLKSKTVEEVRTALGAIDAALATVPSSLNTTRPDLLSSASDRKQAQAINPGQGRDYSSVCSPTNYAGNLWYPLKNFISPIKDQGKRGTCWAFTAVGALESRERVQFNNVVDLSEQFLVNKVLQDWDSDDDNEGYSPNRALDLAANKSQVLPTEAAWTYNSSPKRVNVKDGDFNGACTLYGDGPNGGTCSESSHQSRRACTNVLGADFCSYVRASYTGPGVSSGGAALLWNSGDRFDLNLYRYLLSQGIVLMAATPVYRGLDEAPSNAKLTDESPNGARGVVSNFDTTHQEKDGSYQPGARGNHAMQVVGFISNAEIGPPGSPANVPGGGYFIVKNSWGCGAGDAGFYYVPADYVQYRFTSLYVANTDGRRSDAWLTEQAMPDSLTPPTIAKHFGLPIKLRVATDLAQFFTVTHPSAKAVRVTITSDVDGVVFDGSWDTDRYSLSGTKAIFTANSIATRNFTVVARYGSTQSSFGFEMGITNDSPQLKLLTSSVAYVGEPFSITAQPTDANEPDARVLCNNTVWTVDAPDTISSVTGCLQQVSFAVAGARTIRARTTDSDGTSIEKTLEINVHPARTNPYPRITNGNVWSRELSGVLVKFCQDSAVTMGATIDLRQTGCTQSPTDPAVPRFTASMDVENPSNEPITFEWNLIVTPDGANTDLYSGENLFNGPFATTRVATLTSPGQITPVTHDCRLVFTVLVAADQSRSKSQIVWVGRCTYLVGKLN